MTDEARARSSMGHRIAAISYARDRLECTCGEVMAAWRGVAWAEHRRRVGLRTVTVGQSIGKRRWNDRGAPTIATATPFNPRQQPKVEAGR